MSDSAFLADFISIYFLELAPVQSNLIHTIGLMNYNIIPENLSTVN